MSKSYSMPGWRLAFVVGNPEMVGALTRLKSYLDYGVFQPIQIAAIIALNECEERTEAYRDVYLSRRDTLIDGLARAGWTVPAPRHRSPTCSTCWPAPTPISPPSPAHRPTA